MNALSDPALEAARLGVEKSLAIFATNLATLFTFDGKPIHSPELQQSELARLLVGVESSVDKAVAVADKVTVETEKARLQPFSDPTSALSAADLQDANARAVWVREDCESLPLGDLAQRLRAVHAAGSKSSVFVHDRYAKARWKVESDKSPQDPALSMFAETLRDLGITGPKAGLSDEAQRRAEAAQSLKRWAGAQLAYAQTGKKPSTGAPMGI